MTVVSGLHHVTCVVSNAQRSLDFYRRGLGMTLLARTVNLDETSVLQLYCGDEAGTPGTIISLLEYPQSEKAIPGFGQVGSLAFAIARGSGAAWRDRLHNEGFKIDGDAWSFGQKYICLQDPDGLMLSLVEDDFSGFPVIGRSPVALDLKVGRIASLELHLRNFEHTARLLTTVLGFEEEDRDGPVVRFTIARAASRVATDIVCVPNRRRSRSGSGVAERIIWSVGDLASLEAMRKKLVQSNYDTSIAMDRGYFTAIYFEGPEGMPFGVATPTSGFPRPEDGSTFIALPKWLEPDRGRIERKLARAGSRPHKD